MKRKEMMAIPVNPLPKKFDVGITVAKLSADASFLFDEGSTTHRHDYHILLVADKGSLQIEIDFETYHLESPFLLYIHPDQVHRILKIDGAVLYMLGMSHEAMNPKYLELLEVMTPLDPLRLTGDNLKVSLQALSLCGSIFEQKQEKLYASFLKDCCNAFVGLATSHFLEQSSPIAQVSRFEIISKEFKALLERNFATMKRPSDYAAALHISTPYLNECVRNATGFPVSHHIQQRIALEAKRLLYHSNKSIKEIAVELGFNDYAYFSRFFNKVAGTPASAFRSKNSD